MCAMSVWDKGHPVGTAKPLQSTGRWRTPQDRSQLTAARNNLDKEGTADCKPTENRLNGQKTRDYGSHEMDLHRL